MPKLNLRDLFALVTIVALLLGWWVDHRAQGGALEDLRKQTKILQIHREAGEAYLKEAARVMELLVEARQENDRLREALNRSQQPEAP